MAIPEHEIDTRAPGIALHRPAHGRHGMAIDQQAAAEARAGRGQYLAQRIVIGPVVGIDAPFRVVEAQRAGIDLFAVGDYLGDRAEPCRHARRAGVDERRQLVLEHRGIQLERLAIGVDKGARKARSN